MKKLYFYFLLTITILVFQSSCENLAKSISPTPTFPATSTPFSTPIPTSTKTLTPVPTPTLTLTPTLIPTATLNFEVPNPAFGTGNIVGFVRWNNEPVAKAAVKLCEEFDGLFCSGNQYSINSNADGYYLFKNIKPSSYVVLVNAYSTRWWFYHIDSEKWEPQKESLVPGQTIIVEPIDVHKNDLIISQPIHNEKISDEQSISIKWNEYPNASYYIMTIEDYEGRLITKTIKENEYVLEEPLIDCQYNVTVAAYNNDKKIIAANTGGLNFTVDYEPQVSCMMTVLWPPRGSNAMTFLGPEMEMAWEKHPLASYYYLSLVSSGGDTILDKEKLEKKQNRYEISLPPGYYTWEVISYDEFGEELTRTGNLFGIR